MLVHKKVENGVRQSLHRDPDKLRHAFLLLPVDLERTHTQSYILLKANESNIKYNENYFFFLILFYHFKCCNLNYYVLKASNNDYRMLMPRLAGTLNILSRN